MSIPNSNPPTKANPSPLAAVPDGVPNKEELFLDVVPNEIADKENHSPLDELADGIPEKKELSPLPVNADGIARELTNRRDRWIGWGFRLIGDRLDMYAIDPRTGNRLDDAFIAQSDCGSFSEALSAYRDGRTAGVALVVFPEDPWGGQLFRDCRNPVTGELTPQAAEAVFRDGTYTDIGPWGTDVMTIGQLTRPGIEPWGDWSVTIRVHEWPKWFPLTGHRHPGTPAFVGVADKWEATRHQTISNYEEIDYEDGKGPVKEAKTLSAIVDAIYTETCGWPKRHKDKLVVREMSGELRILANEDELCAWLSGQFTGAETYPWRWATPAAFPSKKEVYQFLRLYAPEVETEDQGVVPLPYDEFVASAPKLEWLVEGVLVRSQTAVLGGPKKSMKTSTADDLAVSLVSGTPFLGRFPVSRKCTVVVYSGETGPETTIETYQSHRCGERCQN